MWVVVTRVSCDSSVHKLFDPVCRLKEVILDGDDEVGGAPILVEDKAFRALFGGAVVLDVGLQVLHAAVLTPQ